MGGDRLQDLMERVQAGDRDAMASLYEEVAHGVLNYVYGISRDRALAEDALQETFVRLLRVAHTYLQGSPVRPWLYAIARHVALDTLRKRRREVQGTGPLIDAAPAEPAIDGGSQADLETLIARMPPALREAFVLTKVSGLSAREAAAALGTTEGAIKVRVHRAVRAARLTDQKEDGSGKD